MIEKPTSAKREGLKRVYSRIEKPVSARKPVRDDEIVRVRYPRSKGYHDMPYSQFKEEQQTNPDLGYERIEK